MQPYNGDISFRHGQLLSAGDMSIYLQTAIKQQKKTAIKGQSRTSNAVKEKACKLKTIAIKIFCVEVYKKIAINLSLKMFSWTLIHRSKATLSQTKKLHYFFLKSQLIFSPLLLHLFLVKLIKKIKKSVSVYYGKKTKAVKYPSNNNE